MPTKFFTPSNNRLLIVVGFLGLLALIVWWNAGVPRPSEANRVEALDKSFSIIHPPEWEVHRGMGDDISPYTATITASPQKSVGREIRFFAGALRKAQDTAALAAAGFKPATFQDQPALAHAFQDKHDYSHTVIFSRGTRWFEVSIRLPREDDVPNSDWWPYFLSMRIAPPPTSAPATMPQ